MTAEEIHDNPTGWINKHIQNYVATGGVKGHQYIPVAVLERVRD